MRKNQTEQTRSNAEFQFQVEINVSSYRTEEIQVKIYKNVVTIRAKQERKEENRSSGQEFYKMFSIPEGQKPEDLECTISKGILRITSTTTTTTSRTVSKTSSDAVKIKPEVCQGDSGSLVKMETSGMIQTAENFEVVQVEAA